MLSSSTTVSARKSGSRRIALAVERQACLLHARTAPPPQFNPPASIQFPHLEQKLGLGQDPGPGGTVSASAKRLLPSLEPLAKNLTALSLGLNSLTRIPESVTKCVNLVTLDLNGECSKNQRPPLK